MPEERTINRDDNGKPTELVVDHGTGEKSHWGINDAGCTEGPEYREYPSGNIVNTDSGSIVGTVSSKR